VGYTGFDRNAVDLLRSQGVRPSAATSAPAPVAAAASSNVAMEDEGLNARRGGGERPGFMDCSPLLVEPPAHVDLTDGTASEQRQPGVQSLRSQWIELRQDVQEGVDFTLINHDAFMRLCEWSVELRGKRSVHQPLPVTCTRAQLLTVVFCLVPAALPLGTAAVP